MIKWTGTSFKKNGVLVAKDQELEDFAYKQLKDYDKNHFKEPHPLNVDDFVENYLGIKTLFYKLSLDGGILGMAAISQGKITVIDSSESVAIKPIEKGTICIDCDACSTESRIAFTMIHESGHVQLHSDVNPSVLENKHSIADTKKTLFDNTGLKKAMGDQDWMEHHANKYAVYILMPRKFVCALFKEERNYYFGDGRRLTSKRPQRCWLLIGEIARRLGVSKTAVAFRLKELNLISEGIFDSLNISKRKEGGAL